MKLNRISIIAALMALLLCAMLIPATAEELPTAQVYTADIGTKVDVTKDKTAKLVSPSTTADVALLTDGVIAEDFKTTKTGDVSTNLTTGNTARYLNKKAFSNKAAGTTVEQNGGQYTFGGIEQKYEYYISFEGLNNNIGSFALYFTTDGVVDTSNYRPNWGHIDSEFDIIVSCDGGQTWSRAWSSVPYVGGESDTAMPKSCAAFDPDYEGTGNAKLVLEPGSDPTSPKYGYRVISGDFDKVYENATNVAYAVIHMRRDAPSTPSVNQYYAARMSEFDVYEGEVAPVVNPPVEPPVTPSTGDTLAIWICAAVAVLGTAVVIVVKKREN